jgi:hypothetical protein
MPRPLGRAQPWSYKMKLILTALVSLVSVAKANAFTSHATPHHTAVHEAIVHHSAVHEHLVRVTAPLALMRMHMHPQAVFNIQDALTVAAFTAAPFALLMVGMLVVLRKN